MEHALAHIRTEVVRVVAQMVAVVRGCVGGDDGALRLEQQLGVGKRPLAHVRAERAERPRGLAHRSVDLGIDVGVEVRRRDEDAQALHPTLEPREVVVDRLIRRRRIARVIPSERRERDREVADGTGEWPRVIERPRERDDAAQRDTSVGRLDAGDATERGGDADRSAGIAARGHEAHPRRDRDRAAAARAAGDARAVPGVLRVAEERVLIGDAEGPLVQVRLAEDDRSGGAQPRGHRAVLLRDVAREDLRSRRRHDALLVIEILQRDRDAVQRAAVLTRVALAVREARRVERRLERRRDERAKVRIEGADARDRGDGELDARELARAKQRRGLVHRDEAQIRRFDAAMVRGAILRS